MKKVISLLLAAVLLMLSVSACAAEEYTDKETVKAVQAALNDAGYACGKPDGAAGKKTVAAITQYQKDQGLEATGKIDRELLIALGIISVYTQEILFQNIPWGTDETTVRNTLIASGFADPNITHGSGSGIFIFPESYENVLWMQTDAANEMTFNGGYETGVTPLKLVGGYPVSRVSLSYLFGIHDGVIDKEDTQLKAVSLNYNDLSEEESIVMALDLLQKLEGQYCAFEKYASESYLEKLTACANENSPELEKVQTVEGGSDKLVCILYGANNTALILKVDSWSWIHLIYTKTDSWQDQAALLEIINAKSSNQPEAGL